MNMRITQQGEVIEEDGNINKQRTQQIIGVYP